MNSILGLPISMFDCCVGLTARMVASFGLS